MVLKTAIKKTAENRNLFPNIFSFELAEVSGDYNGYEVINDGLIEFTIYNHGWATNGFQYSLYDELSWRTCG